MDLFTDVNAWIALATLLALEIVLGVDNIVFISILAGKLPEDQRKRARTMGLSLALITRILLLLSISWVIGLTAPLFAVFGHEVSGRDIILIVGGLFLLLDIVFSLDSVITAVGMVDRVEIMITAVILAMGVMLAAAGSIAGFVERHPTVKMLALAFLLLIGTTLIAEGIDHHIPKGYIYFAMAFSLFVETLNLRAKKAATPVHLREPYIGPQG